MISGYSGFSRKNINSIPFKKYINKLEPPSPLEVELETEAGGSAIFIWASASKSLRIIITSVRRVRE